ncbi:hypothetical protein L1987_45111 [Smallanthus sonchifolius]|uniref:Uncharacterized protein n=1 Tax=Smallanthus sonchifolius TaxID=185202 RepID=A0ACB9GR71_9ASTR|nr:hypothetical protein L1987_45111 [Smallanthus sonchifolius]
MMLKREDHELLDAGAQTRIKISSTHRGEEFSSIYKEAAKALEQFDSPAVGITKVPGVNTSVKQNNFVIQLLIKLSEKAEDLQGEVRSLKKEVLNLQKAKEAKEDFQITIDELTRKLEGV